MCVCVRAYVFAHTCVCLHNAEQKRMQERFLQTHSYVQILKNTTLKSNNTKISLCNFLRIKVTMWKGDGGQGQGGGWGGGAGESK